MMNPEYESHKQLLNQLLNQIIPDTLEKRNPIYPVMKYGICTSGKRIRGALLIAFCDRLAVRREESLPFAVALEMIHAYSLVHDDMPEMDNDSFRRGQLTCHKKYGAALALLAGDGILNYSIEYLLSYRSLYLPDRFLGALRALYQAAGGEGMLGGQVLDKQGENNTLTLGELLTLHQHKTGALLEAPAAIALALSDSSNKNYVNYCRHIGLAFQIKDDILDVEGCPELLGKQTGKDTLEHKSTFVSLLGLNGAKEYLGREIRTAKELACEDLFLAWLADYIGSREK